MKKHTLVTVSVEIDILQSDAAHALEQVLDAARELEITGKTLWDLLAEVRRNGEGEELRLRAAQAVGVANHAAALAHSVLVAAGRLDGVGLGRRAIDIAAQHDES